MVEGATVYSHTNFYILPTEQHKHIFMVFHGYGQSFFVLWLLTVIKTNLCSGFKVSSSKKLKRNNSVSISYYSDCFRVCLNFPKNDKFTLPSCILIQSLNMAVIFISKMHLWVIKLAHTPGQLSCSSRKTVELAICTQTK